jgi:hypothetical protein
VRLDSIETEKAMTIDVKQAVAVGTRHFEDLFGSIAPNFRLEEVVLNTKEQMWEVTFGFVDSDARGGLQALAPPTRVYKTVLVTMENGDVVGVKMRSPG